MESQTCNNCAKQAELRAKAKTKALDDAKKTAKKDGKDKVGKPKQQSKKK
jgi:hypothetical protein